MIAQPLIQFTDTFHHIPSYHCPGVKTKPGFVGLGLEQTCDKSHWQVGCTKESLGDLVSINLTFIQGV